MSSTIMETTATWMPVEHPAASAHVQVTGLLPVSPRLRGEACPQGVGAGLTGAPGGEPLGSGLTGRMGLNPRDAVSGALATGLFAYRTAAAARTTDVDPSTDFASTAIQQVAFLAGTDVPTVPTTTVPTTPVRNEKKQDPGPSVLRPPL